MINISISPVYGNIPDQFILWQSVPQMPPAKPRKVPCDARGRSINPHDTALFMSFADAANIAAEAGLRVGFVLTENDPYFLLDLDGVREAQTGEWDDWSQEIARKFPGAAMEVSISGTGMHIMGRCDADALRGHRRKFQSGKGEFYTEGRFVALGHGLVGDIDIDWTAQLECLIPARENTAPVVILSDGPVPEYTGPSDDVGLVKAMLSSPGSMAAQFGDKASVVELWNADEVRLARIFPSETGDKFDRSSADAALLSHLAFWSGKDAVRMDRLFRLSGLMRPKYDNRPKYRNDSITGAIGKCSKVYDTAKRSGGVPALQTASEQQETFKDCVFIADRNRIMLPDGSFMNEAVFNNWFGGPDYLFRKQGAPTRKAWTAFVENQVHAFPKVSKTVYDPASPFGHISESAVNVYKPPHENPAPVVMSARVEKFLYIIRANYPDAGDQGKLLDWLAWVVQNPGRQAMWSPVLQSAQGAGKGRIALAMHYCMGSDHTAVPTPENLGEHFNGFMENKTFVLVDEIGDRSKKTMAELSEKLKPLISDKFFSLRKMNNDAVFLPNITNWIFSTNHVHSMFANDPNERRWSQFVSALQKGGDVTRAFPGDWFGKYVEWFEKGGNELVRGYLTHRDVGDFPNRAPVTSTAQVARREAMSEMATVVMDRVEEGALGFRDGFASATAVRIALRKEGIAVPIGRWFGERMKEAGFTESFRLRGAISHESQIPGFVPGLDVGRVRIYHRGDDNMVAGKSPIDIERIYKATLS